MTLGEAVELVLLKVHLNDDDSRAEVRKYLRARYQMIWDSRNWRDTQRIISVNIAAAQTAIMPHIVDRILACRWNETLVLKPEQPITVLSVDPALFNRQGDPLTYSVIAPSGLSASPAGGRIQVASDDNTAAYTVSIHGALGNDELQERLTLAGTAWSQSANQYDEIFSLAKDSETKPLTVKNADLSATLLSLRAEETSRAHQRIHFHSTPTNSATALVLCKSRHRPLIYDSDVVEIYGTEHGLVTLAEADMLEGMRQYGKAQVKFSEANTLIMAAVDMEQQQSANIVRLIPEMFDY